MHIRTVTSVQTKTPSHQTCSQSVTNSPTSIPPHTLTKKKKAAKTGYFSLPLFPLCLSVHRTFCSKSRSSHVFGFLKTHSHCEQGFQDNQTKYSQQKVTQNRKHSVPQGRRRFPKSWESEDRPISLWPWQRLVGCQGDGRSWRSRSLVAGAVHATPVTTSPAGRSTTPGSTTHTCVRKKKHSCIIIPAHLKHIRVLFHFYFSSIYSKIQVILCRHLKLTHLTFHLSQVIVWHCKSRHCASVQLHKQHSPLYLQDLIPHYLPVHHPWSSNQSCLRIPSVDKKHFGVKAFSNAAPKLWNSLPITLRQHNSKETLKKNLNTYLFSEN